MTPTPSSGRRPRRRRLLPALPQVLPYLFCIGAFLIVWQLLSAALGAARLPGPINVLIDTWDPYISQPFFDDGGINTAVGIQEIPQDYTNVARVLRLSKRAYIRNIVVPATVPYVFTGLRIAVGLAWLAIVAAEMLKADGGIGYFIWDAYNAGGDSSSSQIILAIVYVGVVGLLLDRLVAWVGRKVSKGAA